MVGTSPATIQSVEIGRLQLSPALARRIGISFGADATSLMKRTGKPKDWKGRAYSVEWCRGSRINDIPSHAANKLSDCLLVGTEALLQAANAPNKKRYHAVMTSLREWLVMTMEEFNLKAEWRKALSALVAKRRGALPVNLEAWICAR